MNKLPFRKYLRERIYVESTVNNRIATISLWWLVGSLSFTVGGWIMKLWLLMGFN